VSYIGRTLLNKTKTNTIQKRFTSNLILRKTLHSYRPPEKTPIRPKKMPLDANSRSRIKSDRPISIQKQLRAPKIDGQLYIYIIGIFYGLYLINFIMNLLFYFVVLIRKNCNNFSILTKQFLRNLMNNNNGCV
jgi:hypothetical protein